MKKNKHFYFNILNTLTWGFFFVITLFIANAGYGQNNIGDIDDRCRTRNYRAVDGWGEYPVEAGTSTDNHDPRIERKNLTRIKPGDKRTFEATYKILKADNTTFAQILNKDESSSDKQKPVVFVIAEPSGSNWKLRDQKFNLGTVPKNSEFVLRIDTYYNANKTKAFSDIYINGVKKETKTHARVGDDAQMRYGNYHHGKGTAVIRVKDVTWQTTEDYLANNGGTNAITDLNVPETVRQGQKVTLNLDYKVSETRDINVLFQLDQAPWTILEHVTTSVEKGSGIANIEITIPPGTEALKDAYQFQTYITPTGGDWNDRLHNFEVKDVDVLEAETKGPFSGTPIAIPGVVEMENYDKGGAGISYQDIDAINRGDADFRTEDGVDIVAANGGIGVGYISNGEWLEYTVAIDQAATYEMKITYSALNKEGDIRIDMDGAELESSIALPATGDWNTYTELVTSMDLPAGEHILRFTVKNNGFNLDKIEFTNTDVLSITDFTKTEVLKVFPNPSESGYFSLSKTQGYTIYNQIGKVVAKGKGTVINLSDVVSGVYFLKTTDQAAMKLIRF